jgi:hypothetical protein
MPVDVDVPPKVSERLNTASKARRWYPFDEDVIDWSVPLDDSWSYMPEGRSLFSGSGILERLGPQRSSFVERWEMTQIMRNAGHGEHLLNEGILAMLWHVDSYDPSYRYLLHEVAEECQHMAMFNQWVRVNKDISTHDAGEEAWSKAIGEFTRDLAIRLPEAFWVFVLLFEFVGDEFNQAMRRGEGIGGRPLHPIIVQIGVTHTSEEARHIAYAKRWLEEGMPRLEPEQLEEVQRFAQVGAQAVIDRRALLPISYSEQLEPYVSREQFEEAKKRDPGAPVVLSQLRKLLEDFERLSVISPQAIENWERAGVFG